MELYAKELFVERQSLLKHFIVVAKSFSIALRKIKHATVNLRHLMLYLRYGRVKRKKGDRAGHPSNIYTQ